MSFSNREDVCHAAEGKESQQNWHFDVTYFLILSAYKFNEGRMLSLYIDSDELPFFSFLD